MNVWLQRHSNLQYQAAFAENNMKFREAEQMYAGNYFDGKCLV